MQPRTESRTGYSWPWNGWPPCARTSRTGANRWCATMAVTATSRGGNGRRKATITPSPASSNRRVMKKSSAGTGRGLSKRYMKSIPYYVRNVKAPCGSSAASKTHRSSGPSSNIWAFGWSDPGHRRRSMIRLSSCTTTAGQLPQTSRMITLNYLSTTITSIAIPNTPGTTTSNHNTLKIRRII